MHFPNLMSELPPLPPPTPPLIRDQRKIDADHLRLLAIFHFVGAGLAVAGMLFLLVHFTFMHMFFANPAMWKGQKSGPPPAEFFAIFQWFYVAAGIWLVVKMISNTIG